MSKHAKQKAEIIKLDKKVRSNYFLYMRDTLNSKTQIG